MIYVRVTQEEWEKIHTRMAEAGMRNLSAYMRKMALNGYLIRLDLLDVREVLRLLRISSNNLNQYAKRANETGSIYEADIKELQRLHKELLRMMGELLDRLSSIYREYRKAKQDMTDFATAKYDIERFLKVTNGQELEEQQIEERRKNREQVI